MMDGYQDQSQNCYFCNETDIGSCFNRSLYHKYNDSTNKILHRIDQIIFNNKQRSNGARKYQQIKRVIDDNENMSKIMTTSMVYSSLIDILEYYKYRKFVPIFTKSVDNLMITEQVHLYYYEKLKIYYNQIKKRLNITVEQSSSSQNSSSFVTKTQISELDSQILKQLTSKGHKQSFRYYQTESKALQNLVNILKKQEHRLKKIKSLKTQDCTKQINTFKDNIHKKSKLVQYFAQNKYMATKKNKRMFFRKIQQAKAFKSVQKNNKYKSIKNFIGQKSRASLYYQSLKLRSNSQSFFKLKRQNSKATIPNNQRVIFKSKPLLQKSQQRRSYQNLTERHVIKSLPKVPTQFNIRPSRSLSSALIGYPNKQNKEPRLSSKIIAVKKYVNTTKNQLIIDKNTNIVTKSQKKKKAQITKTPYKDKLQIDQNDNLASINRKKIEQLKIKSQRKKQIKK